MFQIKVSCVICCGLIQIKMCWAGVRMTGASPLLLELKWWPSSSINMTWISSAGPIRWRPHIQSLVFCSSWYQQSERCKSRLFQCDSHHLLTFPERLVFRKLKLLSWVMLVCADECASLWHWDFCFYILTSAVCCVPIAANTPNALCVGSAAAVLCKISVSNIRWHLASPCVAWKPCNSFLFLQRLNTWTLFLSDDEYWSVFCKLDKVKVSQCCYEFDH